MNEIDLRRGMIIRGRHRSPLALFDPFAGDRQEGNQSRCTELLLQDRWSFHW